MSAEVDGPSVARRLPGAIRVWLLMAVVAWLAGCAVAAAKLSPHAVAPLAASHASAHVVQRQPPPGSCHARGPGVYSLPDAACTPGAIDPSVTQGNLDRTICHSGYSASVRPSESVTEPEKRGSLAAYGDHRPLRHYEYDHLVPLELGGARNDARNLWPEPGAVPNPKDSLENRLHRRVCDRLMTLAAAQLALARDWVAAYHRYLSGG